MNSSDRGDYKQDTQPRRGQPRATDVNPDESGIIQLTTMNLGPDEIKNYYKAVDIHKADTQKFFDIVYSSSDKLAILQNTSPQIIASGVVCNLVSLIAHCNAGDKWTQRFAHQYYRDLRSGEESAVSPETQFIYNVLKIPGYRATLTSRLNEVRDIVKACIEIANSEKPSLSSAEKTLFANKALREFLVKDLKYSATSPTFMMLDILEKNSLVKQSELSSTASIQVALPQTTVNSSAQLSESTSQTVEKAKEDDEKEYVVLDINQDSDSEYDLVSPSH